MEKVKIKVKNPNILEVPKNKKVWNLGKKHVVGLVEKKGRKKVSRAINNLKVWNKNKKTMSANRIRKWTSKATEWINDMPAILVSSHICNNVTVTSSTKEFFSTYSKVAGKIKKIKDLEGSQRKKAENALSEAVKAMQILKKILT